MIAPRESEIDSVFHYRFPWKPSEPFQADAMKWAEELELVVKKYPLATLVTAASLGVLVGWVLKCRR